MVLCWWSPGSWRASPLYITNDLSRSKACWVFSTQTRVTGAAVVGNKDRGGERGRRGRRGSRDLQPTLATSWAAWRWTPSTCCSFVCVRQTRRRILFTSKWALFKKLSCFSAADFIKLCLKKMLWNIRRRRRGQFLWEVTGSTSQHPLCAARTPTRGWKQRTSERVLVFF